MAENSFLLSNAARSQSGTCRLSRVLDGAVKRGFDFLAAFFGLIFLLPLFAWIAWRIRLDSPGPVFYWGVRQGRGGIPFRILKFRTMYDNPDSHTGFRVTADDDPRITPFGAWLRKTKLNELPQLWNVLTGEMSLVGPRPEDPKLSASLPLEVQEEILSIRPGITSPASIIYRNEETLLKGGPVMNLYLEAILPSKLRLDQLYVRNRTFWMDLDILLWTFLSITADQGSKKAEGGEPAPVGPGKGSPSEEAIFSGPISRFLRRLVNWFTLDVAVSLLGIGAAGLIWRAFGPLNLGLERAGLLALSFALLFGTTNWLMGVNRISWAEAGYEDIFDLLPSAWLVALLSLAVNRLLPLSGWPELPLGMMLLACGFSFFGFILIRFRTRLLGEVAGRWFSTRRAPKVASERVLILGGGETGQYAAWMLGGRRGRGLFHICGFVDDELYKREKRLHGIPILGYREDIPRLVDDYDAGIIIFAIHCSNLEERRQLLEICARTPARVVMMPDLQAAMKLAIKANADDTRPLFPVWQREDSYVPAQMSAWLDRLSAAAQAGDLEGVQSQILSMRERFEMRLGQENPPTNGIPG